MAIYVEFKLVEETDTQVAYLVWAHQSDQTQALVLVLDKETRQMLRQPSPPDLNSRSAAVRIVRLRRELGVWPKAGAAQS